METVLNINEHHIVRKLTYYNFQVLPLCEKGHPMVLIVGSEDEVWSCDLCDGYNFGKTVKVRAWRCLHDWRLTKQADGCDYDICSQCVPAKRCIAEIAETG